MKKIVLITFCSLIYIITNAQIINEKDNDIIEKIKTGNSKYATLTSNFKQIKHISILGEDIISSGEMNYNKPDQLSMKYVDPSGDLMLINGEKFVMVSGGKRNETTSKINAKMRGMKTILSACLEGDIKKMEAQKIYCEETEEHYIIIAEINTKSNKSNISKVISSYNKKDFSICILQTIEPDGSFITYELDNKKLNHPISQDYFLAKGNK